MIFYLKTNEHGTPVDPPVISRSRSEVGEHYLTIPVNVSLSKLDTSSPDQAMQTIMDVLTNNQLWKLKEVDTLQELELHLGPEVYKAVVAGDLRMLLKDAPLSESVKMFFNEQLRKYELELWDGMEFHSSKVTTHHALWAAGYYSHSVLDLLVDWIGRPRGKVWTMKSRKKEDLHYIRCDRKLTGWGSPHAVKVTPKELNYPQPSALFLLPWGGREGTLRMDELVCNSKADLKRNLINYED